jgi:hypothetical protein
MNNKSAQGDLNQVKTAVKDGRETWESASAHSTFNKLRSDINRKTKANQRLNEELESFFKLLPEIKRLGREQHNFLKELGKVADRLQEIEAKMKRIDHRRDVLQVIYQAQMLMALRHNDLEAFEQAEANFEMCNEIWESPLARELKACGQAARRYIAIALEEGESSENYRSARDNFQQTVEQGLVRLTSPTMQYFGYSESLRGDLVVEQWQEEIEQLKTERSSNPTPDKS